MIEYRVWDDCSKKWIVRNMEDRDIESILKIAAQLYLSKDRGEVEEILDYYDKK